MEMEVTIGEIIENISLENINIEARTYYASNEIIDILFIGINDATGYSKDASELGIDISKKVDMSNVGYYVESIIDILRSDILDYQSKSREGILKRMIKDVEMNTYGW